MVQFQILSGKMAGTQWVARRFPVRVGRAPANDLQLEENGVWDEHLQLLFSPAEGFTVRACPNALVTVNRESVQTARLGNGDSLEIGSVRMQFWIAETRQRGLRLREWFVWLLVIGISLAEITLIYFLIR